ncbi:AAA family ATPase [Rhizobium helianthi]|uniref:AAA family ATPase n=1 Tax=Rhizobium helianthi TaxID=1132695 RepID=A0ABW4M5S5_9HYPH
MRIHITGASGSGTTTLGKALHLALHIPHFDSDDFFWKPTNPPFQERREVAERIALLQQRAKPDESWILSGSALKWGEFLEPYYDLIVFLTLDPEMRMERIRQREAMRYGDRILPGGDMAETSAEFIAWAAAYDTAGPQQRSRALHEAWLSSQKTPILRLDSAAPVEELLTQVLAHPAIAAGA